MSEKRTTKFWLIGVKAGTFDERLFGYSFDDFFVEVATERAVSQYAKIFEIEWSSVDVVSVTPLERTEKIVFSSVEED